jgi:glycosyltransferase involved in cell wall biosynthesis
MAAGCTVVAADHPESAVDEVTDDAGILVAPTVDGVEDGLRRALDANPTLTAPEVRAKRFDWDTIAKQALDRYATAGSTW